MNFIGAFYELHKFPKQSLNCSCYSFQKFDSRRRSLPLPDNNAEIIPFRSLCVAFQRLKRASISKQSPSSSSSFILPPPRCNYTGSLSPKRITATSFPFDPDRVPSPITRFPMLIFRPWRRKEVPQQPKLL